MVIEPLIADTQPADRLSALHQLAVDLSGLTSVDSILDTALLHCLSLTGSQFGFVGLTVEDGSALEIVSIHGFHPSAKFFAEYRLIPLRPNLFAMTVLENRAVRSDNAKTEPGRVGQPNGHPSVETFLGVPLQVDGQPIGMIGMANRETPYETGHEQLATTFAALIAARVRTARLYEELATINAGLEETIAARTTQLFEAKDLLAHKAADLQASLSETVDVQERERRRIARGLHDGVRQLIVGASLELKSGQERVKSDQPNKALEALTSARNILRTVDNEIHQVIQNLHPPTLDLLGLYPAILRLCDKMQSSHGIACQISVRGEPARIDSEAEISAFRLVQEALQNVGRHAEATEVVVLLTFRKDTVELDITDDGRGFNLAAILNQDTGHFGLRTMSERVEILGGSFQLDSTIGTGTHIHAVFPTESQP